MNTVKLERLLDEWDPARVYPNAPQGEYSCDVAKIQRTWAFDHDGNGTFEQLGKLIDEILTETRGYDVYASDISMCCEIAKKTLSYGFDPEVLRRIKDYRSIVEELSSSVDRESMRKEYSSLGTFLEGYYSPSKAELFVGGTKRGKIYKTSRIPKDVFIYYFDESDKMKMLECPMSNGLEFFEHTSSTVYGYYIDTIINAMSYFTVAAYKDGKVIEYTKYNTFGYFYTSNGIMFDRETFSYSNGELARIVYVQGKYMEDQDITKIYSSCSVEGDRLKHASGNTWFD